MTTIRLNPMTNELHILTWPSLMFWLWLGCKRLEKPPPTSLMMKILWWWLKWNNLYVFWGEIILKDVFLPAIVLFSNYSIPTSCVCFDWSEIKNTVMTRLNQASEWLYLLFSEFIIKYFLHSFLITKSIFTCFLQCWSKVVLVSIEKPPLPASDC